MILLCRGLQHNAFSIRAGSSYHRTGGTLYKVKRVIEHPNYNSKTFNNDIALLELDQPLSFNNQIQKIALPNENANIPDGTQTLVSGWGKHTNCYNKINLSMVAFKLFFSNRTHKKCK